MTSSSSPPTAHPTRFISATFSPCLECPPPSAYIISLPGYFSFKGALILGFPRPRVTRLAPCPAVLP